LGKPLETGQMEEIGRLRTGGRHPELPDLLDMDTVQWLPGGKRISFVYDGYLYVVDAP